MAQAPTADPRERAVSSEPCSTRPNPFDDGDLSSRKRRRTSLGGDFRTRSADTLNYSPTSPSPATPATPPSEPPSDSAMKIDSEPAPPTTPEPRQPAAVVPASEPRSSRLTINARTPSSHLLQQVTSSPPSPSPVGSHPPPAADSSTAEDSPTADSPTAEDSPTADSPTADAVRTSVEEPDSGLPENGDQVDAPPPCKSESGSPPIEIISLSADDDAEFDDDDEQITLLDEAPRAFKFDPALSFPFRDNAESFLETILRLLQYLPTHDQVPRAFIDWIDKYLAYVKSAPPRAVENSYFMYREVWQPLPQLPIHMVTRKTSYPRPRDIQQGIFAFYRSFAQLTAFFVEFDLRALRNPALSEQARLHGLASPYYLQALGMLTRRDEVSFHTPMRNGDDDWSYAAEMGLVLDTFQNFAPRQGGSLANLKLLAMAQLAHVSQFPKLVTDNIGTICLVVGNVLRCVFQRTHLHLPGPQAAEAARRIVGSMYPLFTTMSAMLSNMIDKNINQLSSEGTQHLIEGLADIYQSCLSTSGVVPAEIITQHLESHPEVAAHHVPEAMAYHWKFTNFVKLIRSGQMQLRVMAVTTMCTDLLTLYRKSADHPNEDAIPNLFAYIADILLKTGLVSYILGPTCHPEITLESSNIIGFLVVSKTYTRAHTDALWQTVTSTQDPRVSDALTRMAGRIANLYEEDALLYFLEKLNTVPVEGFGPSMRELCDQVLKHLPTRFPHSLFTHSAPFDLCIRLIRQSSGFGPQSPVAYPDLQQFAIQKFDAILNHGPDQDGRWKIYRSCLSGIAERPPAAVGSLWVLKMATRFYHARDLHELTSEHDLTRLLIEELAAAIPAARAAGFPAVLSGAQNVPRRELLTALILQEPASIIKDLGTRLWHLLVGSDSACNEDRDIAWQILIVAMKRSAGENPFAATCFTEYLPVLDPKFFCQGALDFVCEGVMPLVDDPGSIVLDDDDNPHHSGIEMLWRMAMTAPTGTVEQRAIHALVNDVYIESRSIQSFSHYRARKVHLALVGRCLRELSAAASRLKAFADGSASGDDDSMVLVATDQQVYEQELLFIRSMAVLRAFHLLHQSRPEFSAPDMRSLILDSPKDVEGESAELKYQSFDGDSQTTVMPLNIGKRNTAASLLASLRDATGFESYRIYYRGRPFVPQESDICKSLEDLQIHNGIILVRKELEVPASPSVHQGASPVESEILSHFDQLWEYLSMEEKLAREIYGFLVKLPADEKILAAIDNPSGSHTDIFPLGQPFKSLYAVHALQEYLGSCRPRRFSSTADEDEETRRHASPRAACLLRAMLLVVMAISDPQVADRCPSRELQTELCSALVELFVSLLEDPELPPAAAEFLDAPLLDRLLAILSVAISADTATNATRNVALCLRGVLDSSSMSSSFMSAFCVHAEVPRVFSELLVEDPRPAVRQNTAALIRRQTDTGREGDSLRDVTPSVAKLRAFFWPLISRLVRPAIVTGGNSTEVLELCFDMLQTLQEAQSHSLGLKQLSSDWFDLLLDYTTSEDLTRPTKVDVVAAGLTRLVHAIVCKDGGRASEDVLPVRGVGRRLFWKHLFPPREEAAREFGPGYPIACPQTRSWLMEIIFTLIKNDPTQFMWLFQDMDDLVPVYPDPEGGDPYAYELPQQFEREKAIRAPCGYPGLRNLSNTCYFNSLLTQLFMNIDFREFMLAATVRDREYSQSLLFQTQKLFGFLQDSVRPSINPEDCVASIKTYEDTQIDVVIQMDVDEFYNLLFDRWEGQFLTTEEKNRFRSFFGGQLVQQVRSQECDHVSERLEPFSAIQCDIKGKSSLQESLQAYVDGEIMEGDNKYKCSTCDRHVDAVKRACLKDIPDNLIFHLKRFDFNLRTMQRSKINDAFAFPDKIDMRPYTIEHLSNPDDDTPEDVFELVGVLVHTGTAESGHYYSYIRERPTEGASQTWVEFNDETVCPWDPASMASSCFGGPDYQPQFQSSNAVFEKQYSAYMLFYQRSSSLARNQAMLRRPGCSIPLGVKMPEEIKEFIDDENGWLLRRHCLFDPYQIQFVCLALSQLKSLHAGGCSRDHALETQAVAVALSHLDQVASRTKDVPEFHNLLSRIHAMYESCPHCSFAVYNYFSRYTFTFRMLLQKNVDEEVRQAAGNLMIQVLRLIKSRVPAQYGIRPADAADGHDDGDFDRPPTVMAGTVRIVEHLWQTFHVNLRSWHEVFDFMLSFVKLGRHELAAFLQQPHFFKWLLWIVWADANAEPYLPAQFVKMANMVSRRLPNRPPSYETIIALLDFLLANVRLTYSANGQPLGASSARERVRLNTALDQPFELTKAETEVLHQPGPRATNVFVDRLISIAQNPVSTNSIIANLIKQSPRMEQHVFHTLHYRITVQLGHNVTPYLRAAWEVFCPVASDVGLIRELCKQISQYCLCLQNNEGKAFLDFFRETFDSPREGSGETAHQVTMASLDNVPDWAPGLLGYFDTAVIDGTEMLLQEKLFQHRTFRPCSDEESDEARELADKMRVTARALGFRCLVYLRDTYVLRNAEVTERAVGGLQRVIKHCSKYFNLREPTDDEDARAFMQLSQSVLDTVADLMVVDELEEDASDWENSSVCSGQREGFGDMTTDDLH